MSDEGQSSEGASNTSPTPQPTAAFLASIRAWQAQLMDASRANRAIYYRTTKTTTLPVEHDAAELWNDLVVRSLSRHIEEPARPDPEATNTGPSVHRGGVLKNLASRARTAQEEQGVQVVYLALGWLEWLSPEDATPIRSPLVMIPLTLKLDANGSSASISMSLDDDPQLNPALAQILKNEHRLSLPEIRDFGTDDEPPRFSDIIRAVEAAVISRSAWRVSVDGPLVDLFSFRKVALVQELARSASRLFQNPLVRALSGDGSLLGDVQSLPSYRDLDEAIPAESVRLVTSADSSQLRAIAAAARGGSLVIQGPPGTGKSQTITNLIGEFLAQGKTVLFVAEKGVARRVVFSNLAAAGLAEACLHVVPDSMPRKSASGLKEGVLSDLVDTYRRGPGTFVVDPDAPTRLNERRQRLSAASAATHRPIGLRGWTTPYHILGEAESRRPAFRAPARIPSVENLDADWLPVNSEVVARLSDDPRRVEVLATSPWRALKRPIDEANVPGMLSAVDQLRQLSQRLPQAVDGASLTRGALLSHSLREFQELASNLIAVTDYRRVVSSPFRWLRPSYRRARAAAAALARWEWTPGNGDAQSGRLLLELVNGATQLLSNLDSGLDGSPDSGSPVQALSDWADALSSAGSDLRYASTALRILSEASSDGARESVATLISAGVAAEQLQAAFLASVWTAWAQEVLGVLPDVESPARERLLVAFREADDAYQKWSQLSALNGACSRRPDSNQPASPGSGLGRLLRLANAKRRPALRRVFAQAPETVLRLKPCLLMSPLAVAELLGGEVAERVQFDICIVDEASMITTADLVVAIGLSRQLVVCGDSRQLPPTSFFERSLVDGDDDAGLVTFESALDELSSGLVPVVSLNWHYRSRSESLIAFSNAKFYGGRLVTFPEATTDSSVGALREYVSDGEYGRGGSRANPPEARRVVALLARELAEHPERDVAVTAMSVAQQEEINAQVDHALGSEPLLAVWAAAGGRAKNLETIQGDECDTMILSLGYGRDAAGRLVLNFGPLGREGGERRLNVAVTRARWKSVLVTSVTSGDIRADDSLPAGALRLRDYLMYLEEGPSTLSGEVRVNAGADTESPFEAAVLRELTDASLHCQAQVGVGAFRIDIGITDPEHPGRFVLGVECDGATYHSSASARDRDLLRQQVLEQMGWRIHRIWSTSWFRDPAREIAAVMDAYERAIRRDGATAVEAARTGESAGRPANPLFLARAGLPSGVVEWPDAPTFRRNGRTLADTSPRQLAEDARRILSEAGPLHKEDLFQLLRKAYGQGSLGRRMRSACESALASLRAHADIRIDGDFLWPAEVSPEHVLVRRKDVAQRREIGRIPVEEAAQAIRIACQNSETISQDDVGRAMGLCLGFERTTADLDDLAKRALTFGLRARWLIQQGDEIRAARPTSSPLRPSGPPH